MSRIIHIHVEEPSMEAFLVTLLPRYLDLAIDWRVIVYGSKQQLVTRLPDRMAGYARIPVEYRPKSLVLVDRDDDDCMTLKSQLETACSRAGLKTRATGQDHIDVVNRIVCEELEAWFFGDVTALEIGWPGLRRIAGYTPYRDSDAIRGGTHEALLREMQRAGYLKGLSRLPKIETARTMGHLLDPLRNTSRSFLQFWNGLNTLAAMT